MSAQTSVRVSARVNNFAYAIRNIAVEARKVEASGRHVRYLNIGDPIPFGFKTPQHLVEAIARAMRDGHNGYTPSAGIEPARVAVAAHHDRTPAQFGMAQHLDRRDELVEVHVQHPTRHARISTRPGPRRISLGRSGQPR